MEMTQTDDTHAMDDYIRRTAQLHSAPTVAKEILDRTRAIDFDVREVVACIEKDPALVARILQLVNSPRYGLAHNVSSLRQAVTYIGQRSLRLVAVTFSLVDGLTKGIGSELYGSFWRRALTMAVVASRLARIRGDYDRDNGYSAGLLADLGMLLLAQIEPQRYVPLCQQWAHGPDLVAAERAAFGFGHPALGAHMLTRWSFPEDLTRAAAWHHEFHVDASPLQLAVFAGDLMADVLWTRNSPNLADARKLLHFGFGLDTDAFINLAVACKADISRQAEIFAVQLSGNIDCQALLEEARQQHLDLALEAALDMDSVEAVLDDHSAE